jgi:hypothetical protein
MTEPKDYLARAQELEAEAQELEAQAAKTNFGSVRSKLLSSASYCRLLAAHKKRQSESEQTKG